MQGSRALRPGGVPFELNDLGTMEARIRTSRLFRALDDNGFAMMPDLEAEIHLKCNIALAKKDMPFADLNTVLEAPEYQCGPREAACLRDALDSLAYSYEAVLPTNYTYPPFMQEDLTKLNRTELSKTIQAHANALNTKLDNWELSLLVQFFSWGWPMHSQDLDHVLGSDATAALKRCRLLIPCGEVPTHVISALMISPVPQTSAVVAVDWPQQKTKESRQALVPSVGMDSVGVIQNTPSVGSKHVLDVSESGGVHAVVAAQRGAALVVVLESNQRAARIARFNAWINGVSGVIEVKDITSVDTLRSDFNVCIGPNAGLVSANLEICARCLQSDGSFVFAAKITSPKQTSDYLCTHLGLGRFEGIIAYRDAPTSAIDSARHGQQQRGLVFGWRSKEPASHHDCGTFEGIALENPLSYSFGMSKDRACYWSRLGCPLT